VSSRLLLKVSGTGVVLASALIAASGVALLLLSRGPATAAAALIVTGFGFANIFPTVLGLAGSAFEAYSGTVFGMLFAVALTGGMTLPLGGGRIGRPMGTADGVRARSVQCRHCIRPAVTRCAPPASTVACNTNRTCDDHPCRFKSAKLRKAKPFFMGRGVFLFARQFITANSPAWLSFGYAPTSIHRSV
jgi:hypothetical protein